MFQSKNKYDSDAILKESCVIEEGSFVIDYNRIRSVSGDWDDKMVDHLYERMNKSRFSDQLINLLICYVALSKSEHNLDDRFLGDGFKYSMVVKFLDDIISDDIPATDFFKKALLVFCKKDTIISKIGSILDQNAEQIYNKIPSTGSLWLSKMFDYLKKKSDVVSKWNTAGDGRDNLAVAYMIFLRMMHKKERSKDPADAFNQQSKNFVDKRWLTKNRYTGSFPKYNIPMDVNILRGIIKFLATDETDHLAPIVSKYHNNNIIAPDAVSRELGVIEQSSNVIDYNRVEGVIGYLDTRIVDHLYERMNNSMFSDQLVNLLICYVALYKSEHQPLYNRFLDKQFKYYMVVKFLDDIIPYGVSADPDLFKKALFVFYEENKIIRQIGSRLDQNASQIYDAIPSTDSSWSSQILNHLLRPGVPAWIENAHKKMFRTKSRHDLAVVYWVFLRIMHKERSEDGDPLDAFNQQFQRLLDRKEKIYYNGEDEYLNHCPTCHIPMDTYILRGIIKFLATDKTDHLGPIISKYQEEPSANIIDFSAFPQIDDQKSDNDDHIGNIFVSPNDSDIDVSRSVADNLEKVEQTGIVAVGRLPSYKYNNTILEQCYTDEVRNSSSVPIDPNIESVDMMGMLIKAIETLLSSNIISIKIDTLINYYIFSSALISQGKDFNCLFRDLNLLMHSDKNVFKNNDFYKAKGYLIHYLSGIKKAILCDLKLRTFAQEALVRASAKFKSKFVLACEHPAMSNRKLELDQAKAFYCDLFKLNFKYCCELINSVIKVEEPNIDLQSYQRKMQKDKLEELDKQMKELAKQSKEYFKRQLEEHKERMKKYSEEHKERSEEHKQRMEGQDQQINEQSNEHKQWMKQQSAEHKRWMGEQKKRSEEHKQWMKQQSAEHKQWMEEQKKRSEEHKQRMEGQLKENAKKLEENKQWMEEQNKQIKKQSEEHAKQMKEQLEEYKKQMKEAQQGNNSSENDSSSDDNASNNSTENGFVVGKEAGVSLTI